MIEDNLQGQAQPVFTLFSIGHSNHSLEKFFELLEAYQIEVLVDVRSQPYSKYSSHFNSAELKQAVKDHHLKYLFMGQELGGRPKGEQFYDTAGRVNYGLVAASPLFLEGVERLLSGISRYRVAIMCSEEEPGGCHRHLLISRVMAERGVNVVHIRGDGSAQTESEINQPPAGATDHIQLSLFAREEVTEWKSIRSVLPKKRRRILRNPAKKRDKAFA